MKRFWLKKRDSLFVLSGIFLILMMIWAPGICFAEVGVTDKSIKIGLVVDLDGPISTFGTSVAQGVKLYFKWINDQGGVHGRKLILIKESDGYSPARCVGAVKKLISRDKVFCFVASSLGVPTLSILPIVQEKKIPLIGPVACSDAISIPPKRYVFHTVINHGTLGRSMVQFIRDDLKVKDPKVYVIYQDDDFGADVRRGINSEAKKYNLNILGEIGFKRGSMDLSPQVLVARKSGANVLLLASCYKTTALILKDASKMDWKPIFIAHLCATDQKILKMTAGASEGVYFQVNSLSKEKDKLPILMQYVKILNKYQPNSQLSVYTGYGFTSARVLVEGLKRAGRDLTREGLIKALETIKDFPTGGGYNVTFGEGIRAGATSVGYCVVKNNEFFRVSPTVPVKK